MSTFACELAKSILLDTHDHQRSEEENKIRFFSPDLFNRSKSDATSARLSFVRFNGVIFSKKTRKDLFVGTKHGNRRQSNSTVCCVGYVCQWYTNFPSTVCLPLFLATFGHILRSLIWLIFGDWLTVVILLLCILTSNERRKTTCEVLLLSLIWLDHYHFW